MFYYSKKLPITGTIVVALVSDEDNDSCIYVTLPEYNNCRGVVYKRELPKKVKQQKDIITKMKHAGHTVCVVSAVPKCTSDGDPELIELSIKGVDPKYHQDIVTRFKN